jgi:hypothetical protein
VLSTGISKKSNTMNIPIIRPLHSKWLLAFFGLTLCLITQAQGLQDSLRRDDEDIVSAIAPYPAEVREAILNVSQYPQYLVKLERLQARTSQSFQDLVSRYPQAVQEKFYDLSRYPTLVSQLTGGSNPKSPEQLKAILNDYPPEVATNVNALYPSHQADLQAIDRSYQQSQEAMLSTIQSLPRQAQEDFKTVLGMPAVMNLLTDRIDLTVSLGEAFKNNPQEVRQSLESLHSQLSAQSAKDLEDYKKKAENDPALQEEMRKSSQEFADSYAGTDQGQQPIINNYYNSDPYPYWFGYPYWYPSPMWYPSPLYYHTGFYFGPGGNMVVVGLPSYAYSNWFFNYGYRRYPHMYGWYNGYYNVHRGYGSNMNVYRGYNSVARDHYNHINNNNGYSNPSNNRSRETGAPRSSQGSVNNNRGAQNHSQDFRNSINQRGTNFNSQHFNNFNSHQFHQQSWRGVGGGGMQRGGGGQGGRSGGGGGRRGR